MAEQLTVTRRATRGKRSARRMRAAGRIPAVLYGHGKETISLSVPLDQMSAALRHSAKIVKLTGEIRDEAMIREVQWDPLGAHVLHVDLARIEAGDTVQIMVSIGLRGDAPGTHHGGVLQHMLHEVRIECPVTALPDRLVLNVNELELGHSLTVAALQLPPGARLLGDPAAVVVQCIQPVAVAEEPAVAAAEGAEPEVIGRKPAEEAEETES